MKKSLKIRLLDYLDRYGDWVIKEAIIRQAQKAGYSSENAGRRLRKLAELDIIDVTYRKGKQGQELSYYKTKSPKKKVALYALIDGEKVLVGSKYE